MSDIPESPVTSPKPTTTTSPKPVPSPRLTPPPPKPSTTQPVIPDPDNSVERLEKIFHKKIDDGYVKSPTNEKYSVTREKPRGKAQFPLILLLTYIKDKKYLDFIKSTLLDVPQIGEEVPVLTVTPNKSAIFMCYARANKQTFKALDFLCLNYKYYTAPGVSSDDLEFDQYIDVDVINRDILVKETGEEKFFEEKAEVKSDKIVDSSDLREALFAMIDEDTTISHVSKVVDELNEVEESLKNQNNDREFQEENSPNSSISSTNQASKVEAFPSDETSSSDTQSEITSAQPNQSQSATNQSQPYSGEIQPF